MIWGIDFSFPPGSPELYGLLILLITGERLVEMVIARRNAARAFARGGVEVGRGHWPVMVFLHTSFLAACVVEVFVAQRPFLPWLGWPMFAFALVAQGLRYWVITTLGERWNARVIVVPGEESITGGPFRWIRHPNYVAVVTELLVIPLIHTAYITAIIYSVANLLLLRSRVRVEEEALREHLGYDGAMGDKPRFLPSKE